MAILMDEKAEELVFRCDCGDRRHEVAFSILWWGEDDYTFIISPRLNRQLTLWSRLHAAFDYVFRPNRDGYIAYDEVVLDNQREVKSIIAFLEDNLYLLEES